MIVLGFGLTCPEFHDELLFDELWSDGERFTIARCSAGCD
jgi:hypothetical protein